MNISAIKKGAEKSSFLYYNGEPYISKQKLGYCIIGSSLIYLSLNLEFFSL